MSAPVWPEGWPPPNYVDPPTRGSPSLFIIMCVLTTIVMVLRTYSRCYVTRSWGIDDWLLLAGFALSIGQTFAGYKGLTTWGWNKHLWDIPFDRLRYVRLSAWLNELFFLLGNAFTKVSILLVYRKISQGSQSYWFIRLTWAAIAFTVVYTVALGLELLLICRPIDAYWLSANPLYGKKFTCGDEHIPIVFSAAASVFSDVYSSILPMMLTSKLKLTSKQRLSLYVLFSAGLLTAAIGIARMTYLVKVTTNYKPGPHTHDVTWYGWPTFALTDIEAHLAMICASAPALKVIFTRQLSAQLSNAHVSLRSTSLRRASRALQISNPIQQHAGKDSWDSHLESHQGPSHDHQTYQTGHQDYDVENLSPQRISGDKPLITRYVHIAELHKNSSFRH